MDAILRAFLPAPLANLTLDYHVPKEHEDQMKEIEKNIQVLVCNWGRVGAGFYTRNYIKEPFGCYFARETYSQRRAYMPFVDHKFTRESGVYVSPDQHRKTMKRYDRLDDPAYRKKVKESMEDEEKYAQAERYAQPRHASYNQHAVLDEFDALLSRARWAMSAMNTQDPELDEAIRRSLADY